MPAYRPQDAHGIPLSGADAAAAADYGRALAAARTWRIDADASLDRALHTSPRFVMAHALRAYLLVCGRDPRGHRAARLVLNAARQWPADCCERLHLAAIGAALDDDFGRMRACLDDLLECRPQDLLALQVAQSIDYRTGDFVRMGARLDATLRRLPAALPGYGSALAMQAFALVENGDVARAEDGALRALVLDPLDARAHHVMAHVYEMSDRPEDGLRWMDAHGTAWAHGTTFATHGWWHTALFHLARHDIASALAVYDRQLCCPGIPALSDLMDAVSLLWRVRLRSHDVGARATQLAAAWERHIDDSVCTFADLHAMLAFGLAHDGAGAERLEAALVRSAKRPSRHGATTRELGLPAVRALRAFVRGDMMVAIPLLASLPPVAHRLGGSHAQRDVLQDPARGGRGCTAASAGRRRSCTALPGAATRCAGPCAKAAAAVVRHHTGVSAQEDLMRSCASTDGSFRLVRCAQDGSVALDVVLPPQVREACLATAALYRRLGFRPPWIGYVALQFGEVVGGAAPSSVRRSTRPSKLPTTRWPRGRAKVSRAEPRAGGSPWQGPRNPASRCA